MQKTFLLFIVGLTVSISADALAGEKFTHVFLDNRCYESVEVEYKGHPFKTTDSRDRDLLWLNDGGSLPTFTLTKEGTPPLKIGPSEIKKNARHDVWETKTGAVIESWYISACPSETPISPDEDTLTRPAKAGETVHVYRIQIADMAGKPYGASLNRVRICKGKADKDGWATILFTPEAAGELGLYYNNGHSQFFKVGPGNKPSAVRQARAGEQIVEVFHPVTPRGSWE